MGKHLTELHDLGVTMLRLDAASYVSTEDLAATPDESDESDELGVEWHPWFVFPKAKAGTKPHSQNLRATPMAWASKAEDRQPASMGLGVTRRLLLCGCGWGRFSLAMLAISESSEAPGVVGRSSGRGANACRGPFPGPEVWPQETWAKWL